MRLEKEVRKFIEEPIEQMRACQQAFLLERKETKAHDIALETLARISRIFEERK